MTLKLGFGLPQTRYFGPRDVVTAARALEDIGYDSLWVFERILFPADQTGAHGLYAAPDTPWPDRYRAVADPLLTLTAAAAVTSRAQLGSCVLLPPLHLPFPLARSLATLDALSEGRVLAGLGTGWSIDEYAAAAPRPFAERGAALDEFLDIAAAAWGDDPVAYENERYRIGPAEVGPKPAGRIPILLAGTRPKALRRIARRADGWLMTGAPPPAVSALLGRIRELAEAAGRDPRSIACYFQMAVSGFTERTLYGGTIPQLIDDLAALAAAGADHVFIQLPTVTSGLAEYLDHAAALHTEAVRAGVI